MSKRWSEEEISFLKRYYGKVPTKEIADELGRAKISVRQKAMKLKIRFIKPSKINDAGEIYCPSCKKYLEKSMFNKGTRSRYGVQSYCKECRNSRIEKSKERKIIDEKIKCEQDIKSYSQKKKQETELVEITCKVCGEIKLGKEFQWQNRGYRLKVCKKCRYEKQKTNKLNKIREGKDW